MKKLLALTFTKSFKEKVRKELSEKARPKTENDKLKKRDSVIFERHN